MNNTIKLLTIFAIATCLNACETSSDNYRGVPCELDSDCLGLVCVNNVCIDKCTPESCEAGQTCNARGICETPINPPVTLECSDSKPCPNGKSCLNNKCVDNSECSDSKPCSDGKVCDPSTSKCISRCTLSSCGAGKICDFSGLCIDKCTESSCGEDAICLNGYCIAKCTENSCSDGEFCGADGLCTTRCTPTSCQANQICNVDGNCINKCHSGGCPDGQVCGDSGICIQAECSQADPCPGDQICAQGKCYNVQTLTCYEDVDCGEGYGCDNKKCVDANSCSMTRTCPEDKVCRNGFCEEPALITCDSTHPCKDTTKTCIAGQCVTCNCKENETCVGDSLCVEANKAGTYTVGDICTWSTSFTHCDNNRIVSCTSEMGSDEYNINITNCGAKTCTSASDDLGPSCHEPCAAEGDFVGICLDVFSEINEFTKICEKTPDDKLVWSLTNGYKYCLNGCTNGRCNFVPEEFGENCSETSYPDACQGNWLTYCYYGYKTGTACSTYSDKHFCALPSANALKLNPGLIGNCVLPCENVGETSKGCIQDGEGNVYSMNYLCAETSDGKLAEFEAGYVSCENGCNIESGECI